MNDDLMNGLRRLAAASPREARPRVEQHVLAAFRQTKRRRVWLYASVAAAAALLLLSFVLLRKPRPAVSVSSYTYTAPGFVSLPYSQSDVPVEFVVVMRVQMRPSELSALGIALPEDKPSDKVTADILVAQDGVPRAVRFVH